MSDESISLETPWQDHWSTLPVDGCVESLAWADDAPPQMANAASHRQVDQFWRDWAMHLKSLGCGAGRGKGKVDTKTWLGEQIELLAIHPALDRSVELTKTLGRLLKPKGAGRKFKTDLDRLSDLITDDVARAIVLIDVMRCAGTEIDHVQLAELFKLTLEATAQVLHAEEEELAPATKLVTYGELPWKAGLLFAPLRGSTRWLDVGREVLREELDGRSDTDGAPHGMLGVEYTPWLASLVRSREWSSSAGNELWGKRTGDLFEELISTAVKLATPAGSFLLQNGDIEQTRALLSVGGRVSGLKKRSVERQVIASMSSSNGKLKTGLVEETDWSVQSDWARIASLRSGCGKSSDLLAVEHASPVPRLQLIAGGIDLLKGDAPLGAKVDRKKFVVDEEWDCVCYNADDDGEYVELYVEVDELKFGRQVFLSHTEKFAVLFDSVLEGSESESRVELKTTLPLAEGVEARTNKETREVLLASGKRYARLFPLGLPDQRVMSAAREIEVSDDAITVGAINIGVATAPVVIDWHPRRTAVAADWRILTVAEEGDPVPPGGAVGCRLRVGKFQLLIYRRFDESKVMRSVLGFHHNNETVIAEFDKDGDVEPLLLVE